MENRTRALEVLWKSRSKWAVVPIVAVLSTGSLGCQTGRYPETQTTVAPPEIRNEALELRVEQLHRTIRRLRRDVEQAEEVLTNAESGISQTSTRANAVSQLAEARILLQRAHSVAPWRVAVLAEAEGKLEEADRQIKQENFTAAAFFCGRAERLASVVIDEGRATEESNNVSWITASRVNLRAGPSTDDPVVAVLTSNTPVFRQRRAENWALVRTSRGELGWVFASLLSEERP